MTKTEYENLTTNQKHIIKDSVDELRNRFSMIPTKLWEYAIEHNTNENKDTFITHSNIKVCSWCGQDVLLDPTLKVDDDMHDWQCECCDANCHRSGLSNCHRSGLWYEELPTRSITNVSELHGASYWTTNWKAYMTDFVNAAEYAGFYVCEPTEFDGLVLFYDSDGIDEHFLKLYLTLDLTWHKQNRDWESK